MYFSVQITLNLTLVERQVSCYLTLDYLARWFQCVLTYSLAYLSSSYNDEEESSVPWMFKGTLPLCTSQLVIALIMCSTRQ